MHVGHVRGLIFVEDPIYFVCEELIHVASLHMCSYKIYLCFYTPLEKIIFLFNDVAVHHKFRKTKCIQKITNKHKKNRNNFQNNIYIYFSCGTHLYNFRKSEKNVCTFVTIEQYL